MVLNIIQLEIMGSAEDGGFRRHIIQAREPDNKKCHECEDKSGRQRRKKPSANGLFFETSVVLLIIVFVFIASEPFHDVLGVGSKEGSPRGRDHVRDPQEHPTDEKSFRS